MGRYKEEHRLTIMAVDKEFHKCLKTEAAKKGLTMVDLQREWVKKNGEDNKKDNVGF